MAGRRPAAWGPDVSVTWITYVFDRSPSRGGPRLVLLALADRADDSGRCWPSVGDTARRAGLSERRVRACLRRLRRSGELKDLTPGGGVRSDGTGRSTVYQLVALGTGDANAAPDDPQTLSPASGFDGSGTRANPAGTLSPATANPDESGIEPCRPRQGNRQQNRQWNRQQNRQGAPSCSSGAGGCSVSDPEADAFNRTLAERRADGARQRGALTPLPVSSATTEAAGQLSGVVPAPGPARRRRRLPAAEQEATYKLLQGVPGLSDADARNLARIGTAAEFRAELAIMPAHVRNPGGWLRKAVTKAWATAQAGDGSPGPGPEPARP